MLSSFGAGSWGCPLWWAVSLIAGAILEVVVFGGMKSQEEQLFTDWGTELFQYFHSWCGGTISIDFTFALAPV